MSIAALLQVIIDMVAIVWIAGLTASRVRDRILLNVTRSQVRELIKLRERYLGLEDLGPDESD